MASGRVQSGFSALVVATLFPAMTACTSAPRTSRPFATPPVVAAPATNPAIEKSTELFYEGKRAALAGDFSCAEDQFQQALNAVVPPGVAPPAETELKDFSGSLYESILRYDVMAAAAGEQDRGDNPGLPEELVGVTDQESAADIAVAREQVQTDRRETTFDIPIVVNDAVLEMVASFSTRPGVRRRFEEGLVRSGRYLPMIREIFRARGLPEDLAYVAMIESSFKPHAHSRARARGMWQFVLGTGRRYGLHYNRYVDERADPRKATEAAAGYFANLYEIFNDWYLAMAAYDSGEGRVARALSRTGAETYWDLCRAGALPRETRLYVPSVLAAALIAKNPEHYGFKFEPDAEIETVSLPLSKSVSLRRIAASSGINHDALVDLNPSLRTDVAPVASTGFELVVPADFLATLREKLPSIQPATLSAEERHRVRKGETLARLARRFGVSTAALADVNDLALRSRLRPGTFLVIPERETQATHIRKRKSSAAPARVSIPAEGFSKSSSTYRVRRGDTLFRIASRYHTSVENLRQWNSLTPEEPLEAGSRIRVDSPTP